MKLLLRIARTLILMYAGVVLLFAGCQNRLLYFPSRATESALLGRAQSEGLLPWRDAAGELIGWRLSKPSAKRRVIVFHGNAGYALHRTYYTKALGALDWEVYLFEYPGYGARAGSPGKEAFLASSRKALNDLLKADKRPLYLLGESIGSGTVCSLAAALPHQVDGLILVIPFARLVEVAKIHFPYLPVRLILRDKYDNVAALKEYRGPVAIALAENDEVIPPEQARKLYDGYSGRKLLVTFPNASHNSFPTHAMEPWWREVTEFLDPSR